MEKGKLASTAKFVARRGDWITRLALDPKIKLPVTGIAVILAHLYWNQKKNSMWVGSKEIARMADVSVKTVERHLAILAKTGYIQTHQKGNGNNATRYFTVDFERDWIIENSNTLRVTKLYDDFWF